MESPVPVGSFFDVFPVSVLTTSTLARLDELQPQSRFDQRRFRMNVIVQTEQSGFVENGWVGHKLGLGDGARLNVTLLDPRCVMTRQLLRTVYPRIRVFFGHSFGRGLAMDFRLTANTQKSLRSSQDRHRRASRIAQTPFC